MKTAEYEVTGFYGSGTKCTVLVSENYDGGIWYCVQGSQMVNMTYDVIEDGVDVETLADVDCFTWSSDIDSLNDLVDAIIE